MSLVVKAGKLGKLEIAMLFLYCCKKQVSKRRLQMGSFIRYVLIFVCVIAVSIVLSLWEVSLIFIVVINLLIALIGISFPMFYTIVWETDIHKIERFLIANKKTPAYKLIYALANRIDKEVEQSIHSLLHKHKQRDKIALYKTIYALYNKDIIAAKPEVEFIKPLEYRQYYESAVLLAEGKLQEAGQLIEQISKPWMKHALLSEMETKLNDPDKALQLANQALNGVKGLQKYMLYKTYERELAGFKSK
jgi:hypothetical protein